MMEEKPKKGESMKRGAMKVAIAALAAQAVCMWSIYTLGHMQGEADCASWLCEKVDRIVAEING